MDGQALKEREALYEWAGRASKQEFLEQVVYNHPLVREWLQKSFPKTYVDAFTHALYEDLEKEYNFFSLTFGGKRKELHERVLDALYTYKHLFNRADALASSKTALGLAEGLSKALEELATPYERDGGLANLTKPKRGMDCDKLSLLLTLHLRRHGIEADPLAFSVRGLEGLVAHAVVFFKEKGKWHMLDFSNLHGAYAGVAEKTKEGIRWRKGNKSVWESEDYLSNYYLSQKSLENLQDFLVRAIAYETALFTLPASTTKAAVERLAERYLPELRELYHVSLQDTIFAGKSKGRSYRRIHSFAYGENLAEWMVEGKAL